MIALADLAPERPRPLRRVEFDRLVEGGAFDDERVELLEGVLVEMNPQSSRHAEITHRLGKQLSAQVGARAEVRVQMPLALSDSSEPEPDIAVVAPGSYADAHPSTAFLVVEVAEASLRKDRAVKAPLYAAAGIGEYWIVNVVDRCIEAHRGGHVDVARAGEGMRAVGIADVEVAVDELFR